jgi:hypothetical protein
VNNFSVFIEVNAPGIAKFTNLKNSIALELVFG